MAEHLGRANPTPRFPHRDHGGSLRLLIIMLMTAVGLLVGTIIEAFTWTS